MELHRFEENSKYGYRDENETIVIPAKYEAAKEFKENLAIVQYNGFYGVINSSGEVVIDFIYSSIEEHNLFFECKILQENDSKEITQWYNTGGVKIHVGNAKALSDQFLCVSNGYYLGVINKDAEQIINFLYEKIILRKGFFAVLRKGLIGILDLSGKVIIDAICKSIEQNNWTALGADPNTLQKDIPSYCRTNILSHSKYNKNYYFDTKASDPSWNLSKEILSVQDFNEDRKFCWRISPINEISAPLIITTESRKLIFVKNEGILPNSEYEDVQQLTLVSYVVKRDNLYGVYRVDTKSLIIPIEYEAIKFYGGHTALLCKDGLWGAKDILLDEKSMMHYKVTIPTEYLEIAILDDNQKYFGCKESINEEYIDTSFRYFLVRFDGEVINFDEYHIFESQFVFYDYDHFLTSENGKYGFVSPNGLSADPFRKEGTSGYTSIPFKYDEVRQREDGRYDIRIENKWGVLSIDGRETMPIKYIEPLPSSFDNNMIVQDADSYYFGVLSPTGVEIIPTIYQHLLDCNKAITGYNDKDLFFYGYGRYKEYRDEYESTYLHDFVSKFDEILWGVVNNTGKRIIEAKYGCYKIVPGYIMAGRGGNLNSYPSDTLYDLYTKEGDFLIGGFKEFFYDDSHELFFFFFGGEFECGGKHNVWGDFNEHESWDYYEKFNRGTDKWLILDKNLKTVICDEEGRRFQFPKGFIGNIEVKKEGKKKTYVYNMPLKYFTTVSHNLGREMKDIISSNSIIINYGKVAVDLTTGKKTKEFSHIEHITGELFLYKDNETVGITNINSEIIIGDCFLITRPVSNYIFIAKEKSDNECSVWLYDINNITYPITKAISNIVKMDLISYAEKNDLEIKLNKDYSGLKSIVLQTSDIFDNDFVSKVTVEERKKSYASIYHNTSYFIRGTLPSNAPAANTDNNTSANFDYEDYDDQDYGRDTWDAMTDGMYGDYPDEGYDGDYEFMGR